MSPESFGPEEGEVSLVLLANPTSDLPHQLYISNQGSHPPSPSPVEKERCCVANPNLITTTSAIYLYSPLSEKQKAFSISEKPGLCVDGFPQPGEVGRGHYDNNCNVKMNKIPINTPAIYQRKEPFCETDNKRFNA